MVIVNVNQIKLLMMERQLSAKELAEKVGISNSGLSTIFKRNRANYKNVGKIASVLDVPLSKLFLKES